MKIHNPKNRKEFKEDYFYHEEIAADEWDRMMGKKELIEKRAYELAQKRGFEPGHELDDWLEAEKAIKLGS